MFFLRSGLDKPFYNFFQSEIVTLMHFILQRTLSLINYHWLSLIKKLLFLKIFDIIATLENFSTDGSIPSGLQVNYDVGGVLTGIFTTEDVGENKAECKGSGSTITCTKTIKAEDNSLELSVTGHSVTASYTFGGASGTSEEKKLKVIAASVKSIAVTTSPEDSIVKGTAFDIIKVNFEWRKKNLFKL